jgi:hypothetical protein
MEFNINKVICISLKSHNEQQLKAISEVYRLDFQGLVNSKGFSSKIWAEIDGEYAIAYITNSGDGSVCINPKFCPMTKKQKDALLKIQPIKTPKMPKTQKVVVAEEVESVESTKVDVIDNKYPSVELTVDNVLDKISSYGINSLTKEELNFMNTIK